MCTYGVHRNSRSANNLGQERFFKDNKREGGVCVNNPNPICPEKKGGGALGREAYRTVAKAELGT